MTKWSDDGRGEWQKQSSGVIDTERERGRGRRRGKKEEIGVRDWGEFTNDCNLFS